MPDRSIDIEPQRRIDTLATDAHTGLQRRRSEYAGTVWFGGRPEVGAYGVVARGGSAPIDTAVFLPDSLPYRPDPLEDAVVSCTVAVQAADQGSHHVIDCRAGLVPDPRNPAVCWVQLHVTAQAALPFAVSYRVDVLVAMNGILEDRVR